jgi:hypothetical protein
VSAGTADAGTLSITSFVARSRKINVRYPLGQDPCRFCFDYPPKVARACVCVCRGGT